MGSIHVGVSGWTYDSWRGDFYPADLPRRLWLSYVAERMSSLELNGSFYSLQRPSTYRSIVEQTPAGFPVAVKGGRFVTHMKRLQQVETPIANFFASGVLLLGERLGPMLWQLPQTLAYDAELVSRFLALLPRDHRAAADLAASHDDKLTEDRAVTTASFTGPIRHALEPRHASFGAPAAVALLRDHDVALVASDTPGTWPCFDEQTSDLRYVRLHGHTELYASGYAPTSLDRWAERLEEWSGEGQDCFVYFDNDARGRAPHDAVALADRIGATR